MGVCAGVQQVSSKALCMHCACHAISDWHVHQKTALGCSSLHPSHPLLWDIALLLTWHDGSPLGTLPPIPLCDELSIVTGTVHIKILAYDDYQVKILLL